MGESISKIFKVITKHILGYTLHEMMCLSVDFQDVKSALNDHIDWSIKLFRSSFPIHLTSGSYFFTLCTLSFLVMAESIQMGYGRLSPAELKERADSIGYETLAILIAILDVGVVVVRVAGLFALSGTPGLAASLIFVIMLPSVILPLFAYATNLVKRRERTSGGRDELESGIVDDETRN